MPHGRTLNLPHDAQLNQVRCRRVQDQSASAVPVETEKKFASTGMPGAKPYNDREQLALAVEDGALFIRMFEIVTR